MKDDYGMVLLIQIQYNKIKQQLLKMTRINVKNDDVNVLHNAQLYPAHKPHQFHPNHNINSLLLPHSSLKLLITLHILLILILLLLIFMLHMLIMAHIHMHMDMVPFHDHHPHQMLLIM
jgi:hypothetical protein